MGIHRVWVEQSSAVTPGVWWWKKIEIKTSGGSKNLTFLFAAHRNLQEMGCSSECFPRREGRRWQE